MLASPMSEAILKTRGLSRLDSGHPWIFKSDVEPVDAENGAIVDVVAKGRFLGQAFYSEHSEITLRMLSRGALADTWLADRIGAAVQFREETLGLRSGACRLIHGESDGLPGLIVDRYGDVLVVQVLAAAMELRIGEIVDALITLGGQAHRDRVADAVASARAGAPTRATPALTAHLSAAFDDRLLFDRSVVGRPVLFALPHGAGSLKWALAREARAFLWRSRRSRGPSC